jgi:hypothetical protein
VCFSPDLDAHLIPETDGTSTVTRKYLWADGMHLGVIVEDPVTGTPLRAFEHADHPGTPQVLTDASGSIL